MAGKSFLLKMVGRSKSSSKKTNSNSNDDEEEEHSVHPQQSGSPNPLGHNPDVPPPRRATNPPSPEPEPQARPVRTRLALRKTVRRGRVKRFKLNETDWDAVYAMGRVTDDDAEEPEESEQEPEGPISPFYVLSGSRTRSPAEGEDDDDEDQEPQEYGDEPQEDGDENEERVDRYPPEESVPMDYEYSDQPSRCKGKKKI